MRQCPFSLLEGWGEDRPAVDMLHSHAGALQYNLMDPSADPASANAGELLRSADFIRELADEAMREVVAVVRERGMSWTDIGQQLGISRQAAQQRFGAAK